MRVITTSLFALVVVLAPITVLAEYKPTPPKPLTLAHVAFDGGSFINVYTRGPLDLEVTVANNTSSPVSNVRVTSNAASMTTAMVNIPAKGSAVVHLTDTRGLPGACSKTTYGITMTSGASAYEGSIRLAPVCTLTATPYDPWDPGNGMSQPIVHDQEEANSIYARNVSIVGPIECVKSYMIKVVVYNKTKTNAPHLTVGLLGDNGHGFGDYEVSVPAGGSTIVDLPMRGDGGYYAAKTATVRIADLSGKLSGSIKNQGLSVSFGQICQVNPTVL